MVSRFAKSVEALRVSEDKSYKAQAKEMKISTVTLFRFCKGRNVNYRDTMKIVSWLFSY
jgi:hypothetical protein